ncbi:MAG: transposase [Betaproteobacteria bacterium]
MAAHIIQRGNNRAPCFAGDSDYLTYLALLRDLSRYYRCAVHAYCLMTNHVHILMTPTDAAACSRLMRDLGRNYVLYFNRQHCRSGTLWEGRFRSCLVESSQYVLACHRYIELNPVRAGMVDHPAGYTWSSYAGNAGMRDDVMLSAHCELETLDSGRDKRANAYRSLFDDDLPHGFLRSIREATNGGYPLASEAFTALLKAAGYRIEPGRPGPRRKAAAENYAPDPEFEPSGS